MEDSTILMLNREQISTVLASLVFTFHKLPEGKESDLVRSVAFDIEKQIKTQYCNEKKN